MSSQFRSLGAALENKANEIARIGEALGPVTLAVANRGDNEVVLSVKRLSDGAHIALDDETAETGHAIGTGYTGDTTTRDFTTKALAHVPVVPGTVEVTPTAGGNSVNCSDKDADGLLYAYYTAAWHLCGSIDYFTGLLELHYPVGKAPNTGAITCNFSHVPKTTKPLGKVSKRVGNLPPTATYIISAAAKLGGGSSQVRVDGFLSF
jgi:hypothetical protein